MSHCLNLTHGCETTSPASPPAQENSLTSSFVWFAIGTSSTTCFFFFCVGLLMLRCVTKAIQEEHGSNTRPVDSSWPPDLRAWADWGDSPRGPLSIYRSSTPVPSVQTGILRSDERQRRLNRLAAKAECKAQDGTASEQCAVCVESIFAGEEVLRLPCSHRFHKACVVRWLESSSFQPSCPLCKGNPLASARKVRCTDLEKAAPEPRPVRV